MFPEQVARVPLHLPLSLYIEQICKNVDKQFGDSVGEVSLATQLFSPEVAVQLNREKQYEHVTTLSQRFKIDSEIKIMLTRTARNGLLSVVDWWWRTDGTDSSFKKCEQRMKRWTRLPNTCTPILDRGVSNKETFAHTAYTIRTIVINHSLISSGSVDRPPRII